MCHKALFLNPLKAAPLDITEHPERMMICGVMEQKVVANFRVFFYF